MATVRRIATRGRPGVSATSLRVWHAYVSSFIAPMVIFFSLTGSLQIFDWHEAHGAYVPPAFLGAIGQLHKKQNLAPPQARGGPPPGSAPDFGARSANRPAHAVALKTLLLRCLFFAEALGLAGTTVLGLWIGLGHPKHATVCRLLVVAGTVVPLVLLLI